MFAHENIKKLCEFEQSIIDEIGVEKVELPKVAKNSGKVNTSANLSYQSIGIGLNLIRPISGTITSRFGSISRVRSGAHTGLDIAASTGTPIKAAAAGTVTFSGTKRAYGKMIVISHGNGIETYYGHCSKLYVEVGDKVKPGDRLNEGAVNPKELLAVTDPITVQNYIVQEVQKVYRSQGVDISDKHIEIIVRKMISRMRIVDAGDTNLLVGKVVSVNKFTDENKKVILQGKKPATARPLMLGITKASLETDSFLSAASFQETTRILTDAAIKGKVDKLEGLKENVIIGKLIPAGTGVRKYRNTEFTLEKEFYDEEPLDILEEELL